MQVPPPAWSDPAEAYQKTLDAVQLSLTRMGLDYLDLMLLHAAGGAEGRPEAWRALETAQEKVRLSLPAPAETLVDSCLYPFWCGVASDIPCCC